MTLQLPPRLVETPLTLDNIKSAGVEHEGRNIGYTHTVSLPDKAKASQINAAILPCGAERVKVAPDKPDRWALVIAGDRFEEVTQLKQTKQQLCDAINAAIFGLNPPAAPLATEPAPAAPTAVPEQPLPPVSDQPKPDRVDRLLINRTLHGQENAAEALADRAIVLENDMLWLHVSDDIPQIGVSENDQRKRASLVRNIAHLIDSVSADPLPCDGIADEYEFMESFVNENLEQYDEAGRATIRDTLAKVKRKLGL